MSGETPLFIDEEYNTVASSSSPLIGKSSAAQSTTAVNLGILVILLGIFIVVIVGVATQRDNLNTQPTCPGLAANYTSYYSRPTASRFSVPPGNVFVKNATIWTVDAQDTEITSGNLLIQDGLITGVGADVNPPADWNGITIDAAGRYVTPGLVDMHSHLGVYAFPDGSFGTNDGNEATNPNTPQVRAMDAINPGDPAIGYIVSGGVTTSLVLPGSANVMGGEAAYVKLRGSSVSQLLIPGAPRALKMACGENPKRVYADYIGGPSTRMGVGWEFRRMFHEAATLRAQQQAWECTKDGVRPDNLHLEPLVAVLSGNANLNIHCYMVQDLEMVMRTSQEFNFTVKAFHHALEAWKIAPTIATAGITIATFADNWGFKMEGYDGSVHAPKVLLDAGVNMVLKTDHPVIFAKFMMYEAAKANFYGLTWQQAIRSVTKAAANGLDLGDRLGSLEVDLDGDFVIWDRYPFQLGAVPAYVFIEGNQIVSNNGPVTPPVPDSTGSLVSSGPSPCQTTNTSYVVRGAIVNTMGENGTLPNATIVVDNGTITCLAEYPNCEIFVEGLINPNVYVLNGGYVTPGLINVDPFTGRSDVEQEDGTQDGDVSYIDHQLLDGLRMTNYLNRHLTAAWGGGVTTVIAHQLDYYLFGGISPAFYIVPGQPVDGNLISAQVSFNFHIGETPKLTSGSSISKMFNDIRTVFNVTGGPIRAAIDNGIPFTFHVNQVDEIVSVLRLQKEFNFKLVIKGGAGAHLVIPQLLQQQVSVILHASQAPSTFETWRAAQNAPNALLAAGVPVGISVAASENVRNLRWEAGIVMQQGASYEDSLALITRNVAQIYGISPQAGSIQVGTRANFVGYSGMPLSLKSQVLLVVSGQTTTCSPTQYKKRFP